MGETCLGGCCSEASLSALMSVQVWMLEAPFAHHRVTQGSPALLSAFGVTASWWGEVAVCKIDKPGYRTREAVICKVGKPAYRTDCGTPFSHIQI